MQLREPHNQPSLNRITEKDKRPNIKLNVNVRLYIQLFRERLWEKVHATISKGILGGFKFTVL